MIIGIVDIQSLTKELKSILIFLKQEIIDGIYIKYIIIFTKIKNKKYIIKFII
jgi:hypothetical protein